MRLDFSFFMQSTSDWVNSHYDDLVKSYSGHWILIAENRIIFADRSFNLVYKKAIDMKLKPNECVIEYIDPADAVFYETILSCQTC